MDCLNFLNGNVGDSYEGVYPFVFLVRCPFMILDKRVLQVTGVTAVEASEAILKLVNVHRIT